MGTPLASGIPSARVPHIVRPAAEQEIEIATERVFLGIYGNDDNLTPLLPLKATR
jgi:hypothetical protein